MCPEVLPSATLVVPLVVVLLELVLFQSGQRVGLQPGLMVVLSLLPGLVVWQSVVVASLVPSFVLPLLVMVTSMVVGFVVLCLVLVLCHGWPPDGLWCSGGAWGRLHGGGGFFGVIALDVAPRFRDSVGCVGPQEAHGHLVKAVQV